MESESDDDVGPLQYLDDDDWQMVDVIAGTTAAPTFLNPKYVDSFPNFAILDGGLTRNNPAMIALEEAQRLWPGRKIGVLHSLACGQASRPPVTLPENTVLAGSRGSPGLLKSLSTAVSVVASGTAECETTEREARTWCKREGIRYCRINPPLEHTPDLFDSSLSSVTAMIEATKDHLADSRVQEKLMRATADLRLKASKLLPASPDEGAEATFSM